MVTGMATQTQLNYQWDLENDNINWQGPIDKFFTSRLMSQGSSFLEQLDISTFWSYLSTLEEKSKDAADEATFEHLLKNREGNYIKVKHLAQFIKDSTGHILSLQGTLSVDVTACDDSQKNISNQIDPVTFLPNIHLLAENLGEYIAECQNTRQQGALVALYFDNLIRLNTVYGTEKIKQLFFNMAKAIRQQIRFDDYFAQSHACVFALILRDCDENSIESFSTRLHSILSDVSQTLTGNPHAISAHIGGILIDPKDDAGALIERVLQHVHDLPSVSKAPENETEGNSSESESMDRRKSDD